MLADLDELFHELFGVFPLALRLDRFLVESTMEVFGDEEVCQRFLVEGRGIGIRIVAGDRRTEQFTESLSQIIEEA